MSALTGIEWTDSTWNPVRGCSRVSEGCRNCYAEKVAARFSWGPYKMEGGGVTLLPAAPYHGFATKKGWTGKVALVEKHLFDPLRWKKPRRIFVNSMSDLFHESLPDEAIDRVFAVMALAARHTFQILTKRPERMRSYLERGRGAGNVLCRILIAAQKEARSLPRLEYSLDLAGWPLPNVWLGVSTEDQATADERIPLLLQTPAAVRFISAEPLLGPVNLRGLILARGDVARCLCGHGHGFTRCPNYGSVAPSCHWEECACPGFRRPNGITLDWVIVGGESGAGARPCDIAWIRSIVGQCKAAGVSRFVKQLGSKPHDSTPPATEALIARLLPMQVNGLLARIGGKGDDPAKWPEDLRVQEFPR